MRARDLEQARIRRCPDCFVHRSLCVCGLIPRVETRTRVVLVMHQLELNKPTNTGRLAVRCLPNSEVLVRGRWEGKEHLLPPGAQRLGGGGQDDGAQRTGGGREGGDAPPKIFDGTCLLLFPHAGAEPLERWRDSLEPVTLIVPDGTWRQATRVRRRVPGLDQIPCVVLPPRSSGYRLRHAVRPGRLSTMEAIARALGVLEGPSVEEPLAHLHQVMVDRTLWTNGRLPAEAVTGGIPEGVQSHDPLSGLRGNVSGA